MSKLRESYIERKVCQYAVEKGVLQYKFNSINRRAVPDRIFIATGGRAAFIEFKAAGKKPTLMQEREMKKLTDQGCAGIVIDSVDAGKAFIDLWIADAY